MFKKILAVSLLVTTLFASCSKDKDIVNTGTIRYTNISNVDRYEVFLDGASLGLVNVNDYYDKTSVPVGSHIVKAVQHDGVVVTPTTVEKTITVEKGVTIDFSFP